MLGLDRAADFNNAEPETADVILQIHARQQHTQIDIATIISCAQQSSWQGLANCLSPSPHDAWPVIEDISHTCIKPQTDITHWTAPTLPDPVPCKSMTNATTIIRQRRSAQAMDAISTLPLADFYRMLDCVLPRPNAPPFDTLNNAPRIHLAIFVHRVEHLEPGLYLLARTAESELLLRNELNKEFDWIKPGSAPEHLLFYQLATGNSQNAARVISCHQDIAADSAFSLGMLAEFDQHIENQPWHYRQLFWEAGMIGQTLYLEAEAANVRATGIGCYFDDTMHEMLGIENTALQSLYHFTVGTAISDERLVTQPAYRHLQN